MRAFYNEIEPFAADWLENLSASGRISAAHIERQSIADIQGSELSSYDQVHFFAGIGGWSEALRIAGWPEDAPVWTGSCPCQPYSIAGAGGGDDDPRNLWPEFRRLIGECGPPVVFGEQVASPAGRRWVAGVRADLEAMGYAVGIADLCAAGIGAPHIRQRLFWGANRLADAEGKRWQRGWLAVRQGCIPNGAQAGREQGDSLAQPGGQAGSGMADASGAGLAVGERNGSIQRDQGRAGEGQAVELRGFEGWTNARRHECLDGKWRRIPAEPEFFPLAYGVPGRVGRLRAYGNAIVPALAAEFITAFMEALP